MPSFIHSLLLRLALPLALTTFRLLAGPLMMWMAMRSDVPRPWFAAVAVAAFFSDWLDGVAARALGVPFAWLRRYDVVADVAFYLAALWTAWRLEPAAIEQYGPWFLGILALEAACQVIHLLRFRQLIATHAWSCKLWGIFLAAAAISLLGFGSAWPLVPLVLLSGYVAYFDVFLIIFLARRAPVDVVSCYHVYQAEKLRSSP